MIPEYKMYHGAALAELVHMLPQPVAIDELSGVGRLSSYRLDGHVGLHIKHSSQRLPPWPFTFTAQNLSEIADLKAKCSEVAVVLVCHTDGFVCLPWSELSQLIGSDPDDGSWLRVSRRRRQWYDVSGCAGAQLKKPNGLDCLVDLLVEAPQLEAV